MAHNPQHDAPRDVFPTLDANAAFAKHVGVFGPKALSLVARTSRRTTENWTSGLAGPQWKHVAAMMNDNDLLRAMLRAAGRGDIADLVPDDEP